MVCRQGACHCGTWVRCKRARGRGASCRGCLMKALGIWSVCQSDMSRVRACDPSGAFARSRGRSPWPRRQAVKDPGVGGCPWGEGGVSVCVSQCSVRASVGMMCESALCETPGRPPWWFDVWSGRVCVRCLASCRVSASTAAALTAESMSACSSLGALVVFGSWTRLSVRVSR